MSVLSPPPIGAAICPGDSNNEVWSRYLQRAFAILSEATQVERANSITNSETLTFVTVGALVFYTYTGLGGVEFDVNGTRIVIPASTSAASVASFIIKE
jgi:hypothetical protein